MKIDAFTQLYGIIGHPVKHSLSPLIQNLAFTHLGINAVYLAFDVTDLPSALAGVRALGIKGLSVTIPHKINIIPFLDNIDEMAQKIGAVNTVVNQDGHLLGFNTDWTGAILALKEKGEIKGKRYVILGAGGAARAVAFGLKQEGAEVTIVNRTYEKGKALAKELNAEASPWDNLPEIKAYGLINTTPIGMWPEIRHTPVDEKVVTNFALVMDTIYRPLETKLLHLAKKAGCICVNGLNMLIYQGAAQFTLWTGKKAPVEKMLKAAEGVLVNNG
ncbi:MAG: shikimate dehydrogenase [Candidatus Desulfofervidaceae bacterium]|nr:shikimate dehydrogenase [Candidatus Desulfofervidaceae bacterium]